jgi:hypothetical protein
MFDAAVHQLAETDVLQPFGRLDVLLKHLAHLRLA